MDTSLSDKMVLSTAEVGKICGNAMIFDELLAFYSASFLKPLRTLSNGAQTWDRRVILAAIAKAQSEGILNDREKVQDALAKYKAKRPTSLKDPAASS
jgi:hypothetical protein